MVFSFVHPKRLALRLFPRDNLATGYLPQNFLPRPTQTRRACYHRLMFNFGTPKTVGDWVVHILGGIIAIFLVWWMLRMYVL